ncbi:retention module-containing protein, partial [Halomonas coralii]
MSTPIATVLSVSGQVWARDADGNLRSLRPGDVLMEGEELITGDNGHVQLDLADSAPVVIGPEQAVAMSAELDAQAPVPDDEASVLDDDLETLLTAIDEGEGDLLDTLDATAAGLGSGGGGGGGHSFVELARISLDSDSPVFNYDAASLNDAQAARFTGEAQVNAAPTVTDDVLQGLEDSVLSGNVLDNDSDPEGDTLTVVSFTVGGDSYSAGDVAVLDGVGTLILEADGRYTFTPDADWNGQVPPIGYTVSDGLLDSAGNLTLTVTAVNDAPDTANDALTTAEDTALTIDPATLLANDSDVDGDTLTITSVSGAVNGEVVLNADGSITFTPAADYNGDASFTYTVSDGQGGTATSTATIAVTPVNDAPVAVDDALTTAEDTALTIDPATLLANDSDVDGDTLTITSVSGAVNGEVVLNA